MTENQEKAINQVLRAIDAIRSRKMVIMVDDEDRENEGDLVFAAEHVDAEKINFMAREARGLICLTLDPPMVDQLKLPLMGGQGPDPERSTAFTVSIEAREGVSTGISAHDRAQTIKVAIADSARPEDIVVPGHVFPLRAKSGGVLERAGHTEGSVDLARLAGFKPAGVICEIMCDDGTMARLPDLEKFAAHWDLPIVSIADLITFRLLRDSLVRRLSVRQVQVAGGIYTGILYQSIVDKAHHFALVKCPEDKDFSDLVVDVRVHRQRPILDVFAPDNLPGKRGVEYGMQMLASVDAGVFLYLAQDATNRFSDAEVGALALDQIGECTERNYSPMGQRLYGIGAQILRDLGIKKMRVHASAPRSLKGLGGFGLEVTDIVIIGP